LTLVCFLGRWLELLLARFVDFFKDLVLVPSALLEADFVAIDDPLHVIQLLIQLQFVGPQTGNSPPTRLHLLSFVIFYGFRKIFEVVS